MSLPGLQPEDSYQLALLDQWSQALTCYIDQAIVRKYLLEFAFPKGENGSVRMDKVAEHTQGVLDALVILEQQLADQPFLCGETFSIADALLVPMLDYLLPLPTAKALFAEAPKMKAYIGRMQQRDSGLAVLGTFKR